MKEILFISILCSLVISTNGQKKVQAGSNKFKTYSPLNDTMPPWAIAQHYTGSEHAYFPDYYVYYDAKRKGYVFWKEGRWSFSPALPPFLEKVDLRHSRLKLVKNFSLDLKPELSYPRYMKIYPAIHDNDLSPVPVPIPGNP